jgi:molybdenum cofactor cytidylyltransferase
MSVGRAEARVAALVLAAGRSTRMGHNKLLAPVAGKPMVRHVAEAALASRARPVVAVTGHEAERVAQALDGLDCRLVHNGDYASGLGSSLGAGLRALPPEIDGAVICLGDMPGIAGRYIDALIEAFSPDAGRHVCVPVHGGRRGNPVLVGAALFGELMDLAGDRGARDIVATRPELVAEVPIDSAAVLEDVDSPEDLDRMRGR